MTDPVFFEASRRFTAGEIATLTGAELATPSRAGNEAWKLAPAGQGGEGTLIFIAGRKNLGSSRAALASIAICSADVVRDAPEGAAVLVSKRPQEDFATVGRLMFPAAARPASLTGETGISPAAHISPLAAIEPGAIIEAGAVVGPHVSIGAGTVIAPNAVVAASCQIGRDCYVGPGASLQSALLGNRVIVHGGARIGQDGFGFVAGPEGLAKVPQVGRVVIQDDVEIGANTTVDRGALADTIIGEGTKIDNLVQVGHNVRIGRFCIVAGHCGLSGSVTLGDGVMLGGRVGVADHLTIGERAQVAAGSGLMHDVPAGERWGGFPAQPMRYTMKEYALLRAMVRDRSGKKRNEDG